MGPRTPGARRLPRIDPVDPAIALVLLAALLLLQRTPLDELVADLCFDFRHNEFPLRDSFWFSTLLHDWSRLVAQWLLGALLASLVLSVFVTALRSHRRILGFLTVSMAANAALVAVIKDFSVPHCPWDLRQYGGQAIDGLELGRCWPSGHASVGFCFVAFYFVARHCRYRHAGWILAATLGLGLLLTLSQTVRGAHFLSHGLWTGLIIWTGNLVIARMMLALGPTSAIQRMILPRWASNGP